MPAFAMYRVSVSYDPKDDDEIDHLTGALDRLGLEDMLRAVANQIASDLQAHFPGLTIDVAESVS